MKPYLALCLNIRSLGYQQLCYGNLPTLACVVQRRPVVLSVQKWHHIMTAVGSFRHGSLPNPLHYLILSMDIPSSVEQQLDNSKVALVAWYMQARPVTLLNVMS